MNLQGKHITVMGLGLHGGGIGTVQWLLDTGARITITDMKTRDQLANAIKKVEALPNYSEENITWVLGEHREEDFISADMIIRNPSVRKDSPYLTAARNAGVPIEMDSSLFFANTPTQDIIGITGSKGKTTAAHAIHHFLEGSIAVGTDGISPLGKLSSISADDTVIFELSSWRLEALDERKISPKVAVVTSLYKEHLNTYESFDEYIETKKTIIRHQKKDDTAILNWDDELVRKWESEVQGTLFWFSLNELPQDKNGVFYQNNNIIIRSKDSDDAQITTHGNIPEHELRNILPAILIAHIRGKAKQAIEQSLATLQRLPHRLEAVRELNGVTYVNDSASTMPDATIAALEAYKDSSIVLIIGGSDKNLEFEQLANKIKETNIRAFVWLPGTATERMQKTILHEKPDTPTFDAATMQEAVQKASELAQNSDTVLLSPGATSFGLFLHEFDRGDQFKIAVAKL